MEQFNIKHLFNGELTPLNLGYMTLSAALYTAYHMQDESEFSMVVFNIEDDNFLATSIMGTVVFFDYEKESGDLRIIADVEERLLELADRYDSNISTVKVYREMEQYDKEIDKILEPIGRLHEFEYYFESMIESYGKSEKKDYPRLEALENEDDEIEEYEVQFMNIEAFDDQEEFYLDVENEIVAEMLDEVIDIDEEITVLKEIAQNMLEEASFISENGDYPDEKDFEVNDDNFSDDDFYWETTLEEDEEFELETENYKDVSKMNDKVNNKPDAEFTERLDNMLEYMLTQSSTGHNPNYKYEHSKKGEAQTVPKYSDKHGKFLLDNVTNETVFNYNYHIIKLKVKTTNPKTGEVQLKIEPSELMSDFTLAEVIEEIEYNSSQMPHSDVKLYTMERTDGTVVWVAHPHNENIDKK